MNLLKGVCLVVCVSAGLVACAENALPDEQPSPPIRVRATNGIA